MLQNAFIYLLKNYNTNYIVTGIYINTFQCIYFQDINRKGNS